MLLGYAGAAQKGGAWKLLILRISGLPKLNVLRYLFICAFNLNDSIANNKTSGLWFENTI